MCGGVESKPVEAHINDLPVGGIFFDLNTWALLPFSSQLQRSPVLDNHLASGPGVWQIKLLKTPVNTPITCFLENDPENNGRALAQRPKVRRAHAETQTRWYQLHSNPALHAPHPATHVGPRARQLPSILSSTLTTPSTPFQVPTQPLHVPPNAPTPSPSPHQPASRPLALPGPSGKQPKHSPPSDSSHPPPSPRR